MEDPKISKRKADDSENAITVTITPSESIIPSPTSAPPEKKHKKSKKEKKVKKEKKLKKKRKKKKNHHWPSLNPSTPTPPKHWYLKINKFMM